ncbi:MAG: CehA/McbA family metallohydrolase [Chloroflexi bacterium]|nr:CehA/McbA family metallohydrolase [Chloroflexota bacterium]
MPTLHGRIFDRATGRPLEARVHVLASTGQFVAPPGAILKVGGGDPFFYGDGSFAVDLPRGQVDVVVERGTEYRPLRLMVDIPARGTVDVDLPIERWIRLPEQGWYAGNTHVHYDEKETHPLDRLRLDPRVEDLPILIVSVLKRRELAYASNAFPLGPHAHSTAEHHIDIGEESRHNDEPWRIGLGHIMLINIRQLVEPISRGILVDDASPDYPPLIDACDAARAQGGLVLWCHNANGMEAPVAAALGRLDGINLFDPYWMDPEYDLWYRLLNCGLRLPASTGSDWFVCSSNRVYVDVGTDLSYDRWLAGLRDGRTFVTDGPVLRLAVDGQAPSNDVLALGEAIASLPVTVRWEASQPIDRIEVIRDGEVVAAADNPDQATAGTFATTVDVAGAGWLAARCWGHRRTSYGHAQWAHTSPVYLRPRPQPARVRAASGHFLDRIDEARTWIATRARFDHVGQRDRMLQLFAEGRAVFERLSRSERDAANGRSESGVQ